MNISDWVLIGTALFLGITALLAPMVSDLIKRRILAPQLTVAFEEKPPFCIKTYWRSPVNPSLQEPVFFFRFQIANTGKTQLRRCEAVLEDLWIYDAAGKPKRISGFSDVNLQWAGTTSPFIDLNPRRKAYCDMGRVSSQAYQQNEEQKIFIDVSGRHEQGLRFLFSLLQYPYSQPNCFLPGKYAIKVSLFCENAPSQELFFEVAGSGKWRDSEEVMFRELVITRVYHVESGGG